jgi:hypothetical protein
METFVHEAPITLEPNAVVKEMVSWLKDTYQATAPKTFYEHPEDGQFQALPDLLDTLPTEGWEQISQRPDGTITYARPNADKGEIHFIDINDQPHQKHFKYNRSLNSKSWENTSPSEPTHMFLTCGLTPEGQPDWGINKLFVKLHGGAQRWFDAKNANS